MLEFLQRGGFVLWIIISLSLVVFTLIIERFIFFYRIRKNEVDFLSLVKEKRYNEIKGLFLKKKNFPSFVIFHNILLNRTLSFERQKEELELSIMKESPKLLLFLDFIATATTAAPILGLLGTVTGMIKVFNALSRLGSPDAFLLAKGISEALITTEAGLLVAIPCLFLHNLLASKAEAYISKMRYSGIKLIILFENDKKT